ncbi:MAG: prolyl oligopeptidase family serine peptidase [Chloroflexota bacterium]
MGMLAGLLGLLIVLPRVNYAMWRTQLVLNEIPWLTTLLGFTAGLSRRVSGTGRSFGLVGGLLAMVPLTRVQRARRDMDTEIARGLGADYLQAIPAAQRDCLPQRPADWLRSAGDARHKGVQVLRDIVYEDTVLRPLLLDVYLPPEAGSAPRPAVIVMHGGGWYRGDKGGFFVSHNRHLAAQGYVVFDVQYRFTSVDGAAWPAQLDDLRAAIRWVKANAGSYQVDPERLVLYGRSSGGQLALRAAYDARGDHADTAVCGVVTAYAPIDLRYTAWGYDARVVRFLGGRGDEVPERYDDASPMDFARDDLPPTLLMHGFMDTLVSPLHAENLKNKLRLTNTPVVLLRVPWGRHGFDAVMPGIGAQLTQVYVDRFLAWCFYRSNENG